MARLYTNEHVHSEVVAALRAAGHNVLTVFEAGNANQKIPDDRVLQFATNSDRIVITYNRRDFIRLHRQSSAHAGIIACTVDEDTAALAGRIKDALAANPDLRGKLIRIVKPG